MRLSSGDANILLLLWNTFGTQAALSYHGLAMVGAAGLNKSCF